MFNKYKNKGLTGLANCGNTCYLNSCIQIISHTYELSLGLDDDSLHINNNIDASILSEYNILRKMMWENNCTIAPHGFINGIQLAAQEKDYLLFTGFDQNDVTEFLNFFIDSLHNALSQKVNLSISGISLNNKDNHAIKCYEMFINRYKDDYSLIIDLFYGIQVTKIFNKDTKNIINSVPEPFSTIELKIKQNDIIFKNLYECFEYYCAEEYLDEENKVEDPNENNKKVCVYNKILFWSLPKILIISFKRFDNFNNKISHNLDIPLTNIDLSKYVFGYHKKSFIYDCYGICNHSGNTGGGHYTCYVKNANDKWYHFNDTNVKEINENYLISPETYCLFLRKKNI